MQLWKQWISYERTNDNNNQQRQQVCKFGLTCNTATRVNKNTWQTLTTFEPDGLFCVLFPINQRWRRRRGSVLAPLFNTIVEGSYSGSGRRKTKLQNEAKEAQKGSLFEHACNQQLTNQPTNKLSNHHCCWCRRWPNRWLDNKLYKDDQTKRWGMTICAVKLYISWLVGQQQQQQQQQTLTSSGNTATSVAVSCFLINSHSNFLNLSRRRDENSSSKVRIRNKGFPQLSIPTTIFFARQRSEENISPKTSCFWVGFSFEFNKSRFFY